MLTKNRLSVTLALVMVLALLLGLCPITAMAATTIEINPVNGLNPLKFTVNGGPGPARIRDYFREGTANTFLRPTESVTYNAMVDGVLVAGNEVTWSITGGVDGTAIDENGKLTVSATQPKGDIIVTAEKDGISTSATVTVRIVSDAVGYDQTAKWGVENFKLSEISLDGNNAWTANREILFKDLSQGIREEQHLKWFYDTAGITALPVAINGKAAGSPVSALAAPIGWDGIGYVGSNSDTRVWGRHLAGHGTGHYMSGLAQAYQGIDDARKATILAKMQLMVDQLGYIQDANIATGSYMYGFLSAYNENQFDVLEEDKGATPTTGYTNGRSAWAIYYTQHKLIQGLLDIYKVLKGTDDVTAQRALDVASKMGDWTYLRLSRWTQADRENMWNVYSAGEVGGIAQPIEELFFITGDELYRETATFFEHNNNWNRTGSAGRTTNGTGADNGYQQYPGTIRATTRSADAFYAHFAKNGNGSWLNSKHANTIIPMIVAALREYEADTSVDTPEDLARINPVDYTPAPTHYYDIAKNFFRHVYTIRMSPVGGTAHGETWPGSNSHINSTWATWLNTGAGNSHETCTTINMMQLAASLFKHEQRAEYFDYYERALVNQVMSALAQDRNSTTGNFYTRYLTYLGTNATVNHSLYAADGTCCAGSAREAHTRYQNDVYYKTKDGTGLYVNLYLPSTLNWAEKGFEIVQENDQLNEGYTKLTVNGDGPLDILLRVPYWVEKGFEVKVNGEVVVENAAKSSYVTISRDWTDGDIIEIMMPFSVRIERGPQDTTTTTATIFYGPIMMTQTGTSSRPTVNVNMDNLDSSFTKTSGVTRTHISGDYETFTLENGGQTFRPFYAATDRNTTYCANFTIARENDLVTVNADAPDGNGAVSMNSYSRSVTNGQAVNRGSIITFTATPDENCTVREWTVNGLPVGGNKSDSYVLTGMASNTEVTVSFTNWTALLDAIADFEELNARDWLDTTWAAAQAAYDDAVAFNRVRSSDAQDDVDEKAAALNDAIASLEKAAMDGLALAQPSQIRLRVGQTYSIALETNLDQSELSYTFNPNGYITVSNGVIKCVKAGGTVILIIKAIDRDLPPLAVVVTTSA